MLALASQTSVTTAENRHRILWIVPTDDVSPAVIHEWAVIQDKTECVWDQKLEPCSTLHVVLHMFLKQTNILTIKRILSGRIAPQHNSAAQTGSSGTIVRLSEVKLRVESAEGIRRFGRNYYTVERRKQTDTEATYCASFRP